MGRARSFRVCFRVCVRRRNIRAGLERFCSLREAKLEEGAESEKPKPVPGTIGRRRSQEWFGTLSLASIVGCEALFGIPWSGVLFVYVLEYWISIWSFDCECTGVSVLDVRVFKKACISDGLGRIRTICEVAKRNRALALRRATSGRAIQEVARSLRGAGAGTEGGGRGLAAGCQRPARRICVFLLSHHAASFPNGLRVISPPRRPSVAGCAASSAHGEICWEAGTKRRQPYQKASHLAVSAIPLFPFAWRLVYICRHCVHCRSAPLKVSTSSGATLKRSLRRSLGQRVVPRVDGQGRAARNSSLPQLGAA